MRETLLLDVPHHQVVFTIPKMLRIFFKYKRRLLGELCREALRALSRYFEVVTEGGMDEAGVFHLIPWMDDARLAEIFARQGAGRSCPLSPRGPRLLRPPFRHS